MTGFTKSLKNKLLAVFIAVFVLCAGTITVFAATGVYNDVYAEEEELLTITVSQETADTGNVAEVNISLKNYSKLVACKIQVFYEEEVEFVVGKFNEEIEKLNTKIENGNNVVTLSFMSGEDNIILGKDDVLATLSFKMSERGEENLFCPITVECNKYDVLDENRNPINFEVVSGGVLFTNSVAGDVNGDGYFDIRDVLLLFYFHTNEEKYSAKIVTKDINGDGHFDMRDVLQLFQYQFGKSGVPKPHIPMVFKVTFDGNGGTLVSGEETQKVKENKSATAPKYEREGYKFTGFDKQEEMSCVTKTMTVKAQWEKLVTHEHTYSEEWSSDGAFHWHAATCEHTTEVSDHGTHEWNSTIDSEKKEKISTCSVCGKVKTEKLVDYSADYNKYSELGKTINLITASDFEVYSGAKSVFNSDYLYYKKLSVYDKGASDGVSSSTQSASDYLANIYSSVEAKISIGSRKDKNGKFMTNKLPSLSVGASSTYEKKRKTETSEYYYTYSFTYNGSERYIEGFRDVDSLRSIVSYDLISDAIRLRANQITPAQFVTYWGTHVITSAIYGQEINVDYSCITTSESNTESLKNKLDAEMEMRFAKTGVDASVGVDSSFLKTDSNSNTIQSLNINGRSKEKFGATSMEDFGKAYDKWREKNGGDVFIDVPEGSLYCVWDLLGKEYNDVKQLLDDYMYSECDKLSGEVLAKINSLKYEDDLKFDKDTQTLFLNLKYYQEHSDVGVDTFDRGNFEMKNGVLNVTPYYNGTPIKKIVIDGAYGQRNLKGQVIDFVVKNFALKFDRDFDEDLEIELNNVAFSAPSNTACFDFSEVLNKNIKVNINYNGKNYLEGGGGTAAKGVFNADGIDLGIIGSTGAELIVRGGAGAGDTSAVANETKLVTYAGDRVNNKDGSDGAIAIIAKSLTINTFGALEVYGGNGGAGFAGENKETTVNAQYGEAGGDGGNGGNGAKCADCEHFYILNAYSILFVTGDGGNGGDGGKGSDAKFSASVGGNGGQGGNGGKYGERCFIENNILVKELTGKHGTGGTGGAGGIGYSTLMGNLKVKGSNGEDGIGLKSEATYNGHTYVLMSGKLTWAEAKAYAESMGGHLATITNAEEDAVLGEMIRASGYGGLWLGAENTSGSWKWVTGEEFSFTNWSSGEPSGGDEHYLGYKNGNNEWNDYRMSDGAVFGFIVEFE